MGADVDAWRTGIWSLFGRPSCREVGLRVNAVEQGCDVPLLVRAVENGRELRDVMR